MMKLAGRLNWIRYFTSQDSSPPANVCSAHSSITQTGRTQLRAVESHPASLPSLRPLLPLHAQNYNANQPNVQKSVARISMIQASCRNKQRTIARNSPQKKENIDTKLLVLTVASIYAVQVKFGSQRNSQHKKQPFSPHHPNA